MRRTHISALSSTHPDDSRATNQRRRDVMGGLLKGIPLSLLLHGCGSGNTSTPGMSGAAASDHEPDTANRLLNESSQGATPAHAAQPQGTEQSYVSSEGIQDFRETLHTPTLITRLKDRYFIVDCHNHRIIYSDRLDASVTAWKTLDEDIAGPHSIATDGTLYVAEDTGRHGLKVYREVETDRFQQVQYLPDIGKRPHRTLYDTARGVFVVLGSADQTLHVFAVRDGLLERVFFTTVPELNGRYCRSITLRGEVLYLVGNDEIVAYQFDGTRLAYAGRRWTLAEICRGSNDIYFLENDVGAGNHPLNSSNSTAGEASRADTDPLTAVAGILTSTPVKAFLFTSLNDLVTGSVQDISSVFQGTPYYVSQFDGKLWIPEITQYSAIRHYPLPFSAESLHASTTLIDAGEPQQISIDRKFALPM